MHQENIFIGESIVGYIITAQPIQGSKINDSKVLDFILNKNKLDKVISITDILKIKFKIKGSPRLQTIWNFKDWIEDEQTIHLKNIILRSDNFCIACNGSGKYLAIRHKATAKCPTCKGAGYVNNVWFDTPEIIDKKEGVSPNDKRLV